jgi:hypothetical protein
MAAFQPPAERRRRPRRGTLARPVNGQLYRSCFLFVSLPLLLAAFSVTRPVALQRPLLPPAFDTKAALALASDLATQYPDRVPGSPSAHAAAGWFRSQLNSYGLPATIDSWRQSVPGLGRARLENVVAVAAGQSPQVIVVMAHRDDTGAGPGANDNASGTAALVELARGYAQPETEAQVPVQSAHTLVFLSTDGGAYGALGALHFLQTSDYRDRILAVVNLDALAGPGHPRIEFGGDRPRSPPGALVATAAARLGEQTGSRPHHAGVFGQLIDLGFPLTVYEQGPFVAAGVPAVTLTTGGTRPPPAFGDTVSRLRSTKLAQMGRAAQELLGSLNQALELSASTTSSVWIGDRLIRGWAIKLVLIALLLPFIVAAVDLYALCRRFRVPLLGSAQALRSRLIFWFFAAGVFTCFRLLGAWPSGPARPPNPATPLAGNWPVLGLLGLGVVVGLGWLVVRYRLVPRHTVAPDERLAGHTVALLALVVVGLLVVATNPFALVFALPAFHLWLWLPQLRTSPATTRVALFLLGLIGPALILLSLGWRLGLGLDAPWYLLELVSIGYVKPMVALVAVAAAAPAAQLAVAAAGRYAPYPAAHERGPRGPIRELVRAVVLGLRAHRREVERRRQALGA